ncbi:hypothetical protein [Massilia eburnea]|uniref:hypothetical protein n=1 Tax=Massilia eburnea TaxID=1776165 RepID=UPI003D6C4AFD
MKIRFSPSTGAFYPLDIDYGDKLPIDVIEVLQEDYDAAMARPVGHSFAFVNGKLVITAPSPLPFADAASAYMTEVRETREAILNRLAGIGMAAVIAGDMSSANAIALARQSLLDLPSCPLVSSAMNTKSLAKLEEAVKVRYKEIVAAVPLAVRTAFNQVSQ